LRASRVILLVIVVCLVGFGLVGLNSQRTGYDAEFDSKLIPIDKPTALGVCIPIKDARAYTPLNYNFDEKLNYRIKAVGGNVHFKVVFARALAYRTADWSSELILMNNTETHFWPWRLKSIKVMGPGSLLVVPLGGQDKEIPEARVYKATNYTKKIPSWSERQHLTSRSMRFSTQLGDLWMVRNRENIDLTFLWQERCLNNLPARRAILEVIFLCPGNVDIMVPKRWGNRPVDVTARFIGNFVLVANGRKTGKNLR